MVSTLSLVGIAGVRSQVPGGGGGSIFYYFFMYEMIMFRFMKLRVFDDDLIMLQVISDPISYLRVLINAQLNFTLYSVLRRACIHGVVPCCLQQRCCSAMRWRYVCLPFRDTHI